VDRRPPERSFSLASGSQSGYNAGTRGRMKDNSAFILSLFILGIALSAYYVHTIHKDIALLHKENAELKIQFKELTNQEQTQSCTLPGETCTWQVHP
jgi:hypothetical protein